MGDWGIGGWEGVAWIGWQMALHEKDTVLFRPKDLKTKLASVYGIPIVDLRHLGVELLPDGTFVTRTYGHWPEGEVAYVVSVRFKLEELDGKVM